MEVETKGKGLDYITLTDLKGRGWTTKMIKMFYDTPDKVKSNPRFINAPPMKLYLLSNVEEKEKNKEWLDYFDQIKESRLKQKNRVLAVNEKKRKELIKYISNIEINIKSFPKDKLYQKAVYHYNDLWSLREEHDTHASVSDSPIFFK